MKLTRFYTGEDNRTHFEDLDIPFHLDSRSVTDPIPTLGVVFSESGMRPPRDWHHAPRRQIVVILEGEMEIEVGDGTKRRFGVGDSFYADDLTGQGHIQRDTADRMRLLYVLLPDDLDPTLWRPAH